MTEHDELLAAAIRYAERGWLVFPCHSITPDGHCTCGKPDCGRNTGKHPRTPHGCKDATTDVGTIMGWWERWPTANVAIATGKESGIWVLDLDGAEGIDAWEKLCCRNGLVGWNPTYSVNTPGGGRHLYFAYPDDVAVGNRQDIMGMPIDVRGDGGYVLAPPSWHLTGRSYRESP